MEKLFNTWYEYLQYQFRWQTGMKEEKEELERLLERLRENHPKIQAVVFAASQVHITDQNPALNKWLWQLRDANDEIDDFLDEFEYMKYEEQRLARNMEETKKRSIESSLGFPQKLRGVGESAFKIDPNLKRLHEIVQKLDKISADLITFSYILKDTKQEQRVQQHKLQNNRETGSMPKNVLIGRAQDMKFVIQWLGKVPSEEHQSHVSNIPNYNNISVLSIEGPGGMGKTTLLQHIYDDKITKEFDLKMWVCVSNNFDVKKVIADMLESHKLNRPFLESLDALQTSLKLVVMSKKFLLVLDDIWEEDEEQDKSKWENVLAPLSHGGFGSKILITTRMNSAAMIIAKVIKKKNEVLKLEGLKEDECLQLLNTHAFVDAEKSNEHNKLRSIARELVKKLYGSPLAAKVLGGALNSNLDEIHWRNVLNNVFGQNGISSILELSYIVLPKYLQDCFAFCGIFQQDHIFHKDDLVRMWIAVGFIQPSCICGETLEDIGKRYFDILVKKSFFDKFDKVYKMHDLLYELAQSVSAQECFRIVGDEDSNLTIPETIRHLSVKTGNLELLKKMRKFKNLRTFCITYYRDNQDLVDVLTKIFEESRSIRLLSIFAYNQKMIPENIGCLKHLRYLGFEYSDDTVLPRSVSNLYHLQFLICKNRASLCQYSAPRDDLFPRDMNNLSNMRYLRSPHLKFPGIGKMKFLQELNGFEVKNENGYRIEELEHMNDLRILRIKGLENVTDVQEACNAKLCDKRKLTDLSLEWGDIHDSEDQLICARVLDNLQPHNNLKKLRMCNYMGVRSAIWMNNVDLINNLEHIRLLGCWEWKNLPPFGQLPFLKCLELGDMPEAEWFDNKFHGKDFDAGDDCLFPCITKLWLYNCPNLQELPYLPPKLKELNANNIGWKTLNCCSILKSNPCGKCRVLCSPNITNISMYRKITGLTVRTNVELEDCPNLLSIGGHQEVETTENCLNLIVDELNISDASVLQMKPMRSITSVRKLAIEANFKYRYRLSSSDICDASVLQMEPMRSITSVRMLTIEHNVGSVSFPFEAERWFLQVSSSLRELYFKNLISLQSLPSYLTSLSSLEILRLENIPLLKSLPDLPLSLRKLTLTNLDNLNCLPSCIPSLSSLTSLSISRARQLRELPGFPPSLGTLKLFCLDNLNCLPSWLPSLSSLTQLSITYVRQLQELPDLPASLCALTLQLLDNLNCLPSCLPTLSSLTKLSITYVRQLQELPDFPHSLRELNLRHLNNLNCLPSCLPSLSFLTQLYIERVPQLRELPDLPPSLRILKLINLDNLNCLPSCLPTLSSLTSLIINNVPQLWELQDLSPSLRELKLYYLPNLNCLPSCLPTLSSLTSLSIIKVPQLRELPDLPPSLISLNIQECDQELMKLRTGFR